jgi:hypothetical protein
MNPKLRILAVGAAAALAGCSATAPSTNEAKAPPSGERDWTWVQGAVFVPTTCVNEAEQWDRYDPVVNERELRFASVYGINVVRVYLHYYVYLKKKDALLADIDDFLGRASKYGIRTEFVFFDDCWNQPPKELLSADYRYPAPIPGVHNSQWLVCPGDDVREHYAQHRQGLKAYVQDIVNAHKSDPRVVFWEIYNEPNKSAPTVNLEKDAYLWIKETGTDIPVTATGKEFSGGPFSDFASWHEYGDYGIFGGANMLCTECMNRQGQSVPGVVEHFKGKTGYIMWEFGIGRDNCRFAWSENREKPRPDETPTPFHGIVYPDGHPWSIADAKALLGPDGYAKTPFFMASYFKDPAFTQLAKTSVTPVVDFDLVDEAGVGSPDASAGVPRKNFSIEYRALVQVPVSGTYGISVDTDGVVQVIADGKTVLRKDAPGRGTATAQVALEGYRNTGLVIRYAHGSGPASLHLTWSGPTFKDRLLEPSTHPDGI